MNAATMTSTDSASRWLDIDTVDNVIYYNYVYEIGK